MTMAYTEATGLSVNMAAC